MALVSPILQDVHNFHRCKVKKLQAEWKVEQAEQAAKASKKRKAPKEEAQKEEEKQDTQQNASVAGPLFRPSVSDENT